MPVYEGTNEKNKGKKITRNIYAECENKEEKLKQERNNLRGKVSQ
jgi:hypothetical protein